MKIQNTERLREISDSHEFRSIFLRITEFQLIISPHFFHSKKSLLCNFIKTSLYFLLPPVNRFSVIPLTVRACFSSIRITELPSHSSSARPSSGSTQPLGGVIQISYCFFGLMTSYLVWGLLQEKIITQPYESVTPEGHHFEEYFHDSQFLVFANRSLAFLIALIYLCVKNQLQSTTSSPLSTIVQITGSAPLFKYSFASFSNIMSAWFQYEALKFVNFPTQVLAKSCKIIPVMLMGKIVSRSKFEFYEYLTAALISVGMLAFLLGSKSDHHTGSSITSMTGILLLAMYLVFDSFTSNWQSDLFKTYGMSSIQMMCGVNLFSALFTAMSLAIQGGFMESFIFATTVSDFLRFFLWSFSSWSFFK